MKFPSEIPSPIPRRGQKWTQAVLESVFTTIAIGAVVVAVVFALETATAEHLDRTVGVEDAVGAIDPSHVSGYTLDVRSATLVIEDPSILQRLATMLPVVIGAGTVGTAAVLLWLVSRSLREGELFTRDNVRRLKSCANTVLVGGLLAAGSKIAVSLWFLDAADDLPVEFRATGSLVAIPIALALAGLAEIFRRGAALRDDVEGLV